MRRPPDKPNPTPGAEGRADGFNKSSGGLSSKQTKYTSCPTITSFAVCQGRKLSGHILETDAGRAELTDARTCTAAGITGRGTTPTLALCRGLIAAGLNPDQAMEVYHGATLALRIRRIGEAAGLEPPPEDKPAGRRGRRRLKRIIAAEAAQ
jgi:hypothetical protein